MELFDVTSLLTNVSLNDNLDIILQRIYIDMKSDTTIPKREMKDLLYLCTKMRISFNGEICVNAEGVAMGSSLEPVLEDIFMVEPENYHYSMLGK